MNALDRSIGCDDHDRCEGGPCKFAEVALPCPFCGVTPEMWLVSKTVNCANPHCALYPHTSIQVELWNRRASRLASPRATGSLREQIEALHRDAEARFTQLDADDSHALSEVWMAQVRVDTLCDVLRLLEASPSLASATAGVNICARCEGRGWITVHESTGQTSRVSNAKCPECHGLQLVPVSPDTTSPWRPIETAPRDGTHILVTVLDKGGFGYCGGKRQDWCAVVHYWPHEGEEGFYLSTGATGFDDRPMDCTHWIPLGSPAASPPDLATFIGGDEEYEEEESGPASPPVPESPSRPEIVCLCGSTRFMDHFFEEGWRLTLEGKIVLSVGVVKTAEHHAGEALGQDVADRLDTLHLRKIDLADRVLVLNVGGYIGSSTRKEITYTESLGKPIDYLEPVDAHD